MGSSSRSFIACTGNFIEGTFSIFAKSFVRSLESVHVSDRLALDPLLQYCRISLENFLCKLQDSNCSVSFLPLDGRYLLLNLFQI